jgi:flagellar M-ring protein FliF
VLNLVAAAVPGLRAQNISIVDSRGTMLARAGQPSGPAAAAQGTEEMRRATELRLSHAVEEMLERSLGPGRVRAEAAVEMEFERINETQERYDPDGSVTRSTQSVSNSSRSNENNNAVGTQNNLPNAEAANAQSGNQEQRQEETTNFELSRTVRTLVREQPQIKRISLAVMVDGLEVAGPDGKLVWRTRPDEELARITGLVRGAIGFNESRGDHVQVVSMRFANNEDTAPESNDFFGFPKPDLMRLAEIAMIGLVAILALFAVLRPMALRLSLAPHTTLPRGTEQNIGALGGRATLGVNAPGAVAALTGPDHAPDFADAEEEMVNRPNVTGQIRANAMRRIAELANKHPEETLTILRGWMARENS